MCLCFALIPAWPYLFHFSQIEQDTVVCNLLQLGYINKITNMHLSAPSCIAHTIGIKPSALRLCFASIVLTHFANNALRISQMTSHDELYFNSTRVKSFPTSPPFYRHVSFIVPEKVVLLQCGLLHGFYPIDPFHLTSSSE